MAIPTSSIYHHLAAPLNVDILLEIQLILVTFSIGIQDAISYSDFHCFASNQTGNSVVLAISIAGLDGDLFSLSNVALSLDMFIGGAIITGQIANAVGPRRRAWLVFSHLCQTLMIFESAAIQAVFSAQGTGNSAMAVLALLAFSSGS